MNAPRPHARRRIRILAPLLLVAVAALITTTALVWASFTPTASIELSNTDESEPVDITSLFQVPAGDVNFDAVVTFTPAECEGGTPGFFVASDADIPDGTEVGQLGSDATLGLTITACNITLGVEFTLVDATTDTTNSFVDSGSYDLGPGAPGTWNGYDIQPSGNMRAVDQYPGFLLDLYPGLEPRARYFGWTEVPAPFPPGLFVILQFMVFEPGECPATYNCPEDWGYPSVTVLNIPNAPASAGSPLGDFCSPLSTENTVLGEADGLAVRTNPSCGTSCTFHSWARGLPDADGDGYENGIDTCPFDVNTDTNPRGNVGPDTDAIDASCDPEPAANNTDYDGDGFANNADNCPLLANGTDPDNQLDGDEDGIGDACDTEGDGPNSVDGSRDEVTNEDTLDISGGACVEETATATPTPTATAAPGATGTATATGTPTPEVTATPSVVGEGCAPVIPGTYNGLVRLNGVPAPAGYEVTATIDGVDWGSTIVSGGRYALDVPQKLPATEPCFAGGTITFTIDGGVCEPTVDWASGLHDVDLSCAPAATPPPVTPPPATPPPATPPPATPAKPPTTGGGGLGGDEGLPLWVMLLAGWASLTALAGLGTVATRIVRR